MLPPVYFSVIASFLAAGAAEEVPTMSTESDYENIESTLQKNTNLILFGKREHFTAK